MSACAGDKGPEVTDRDEGFLRRGFKKKGRTPAVLDQLTGVPRPPAQTFELRPKDEGELSGNLESLLSAAHRPLHWGADLGRFFVARVTVGACNDCGLRVFPDTLPENPYHAVICGLLELLQADKDGYERALDALAKASTIAAE